MSKQSQADEGLAPEQYAALNEMFYRHAPDEQFALRLRALIAFLAKPTQMEHLTSEMTFGALTLRAEPNHDTSELLAVRNERFVALEAETLFHHICETLFLMFFAHRGEPAPECPWLEVARLRAPRVFKEKLAGFVDSSSDIRSSVQDVFFGGNFDPRDVNGKRLGDGEVGRLLDDHISLLRSLAARLLGEAGLYNAAKHGMAVQVEDSGFDIHAGGARMLSSDGLSVAYLELAEEVGTDGSKRPYWARTTIWTSPEEAIIACQLAQYCLRALWAVARWRYQGRELRASDLFIGGHEHLSLLHRPGNPMRGYREELAYSADTESGFAPKLITAFVRIDAIDDPADEV